MKNIQSFKEKFGATIEINKDIINDVINDISDEYNSVDVLWMNSIPLLKINSNEKIDELFFKNVMSKLISYYYQETGVEIFAVYLPSDFKVNPSVGIVFPITFLRIEVYPYLFLNKLVAIKRNEDIPKLNESNSNKEFVDTDIIMDVLSDIKDEHDIEISIYEELEHIGVNSNGYRYRFYNYMIRLKGLEKLDNLISIIKKSIEYYYQETGEEIACVIFEYKSLNHKKSRLLYDIDFFKREFLSDIYLENRKDYLYVTKDESGNLDDLDYHLPTKSTITILEGKFNYKSIPEFLNWFKQRENKNFIFFDSETTGLRHPSKEQLTQIGAVATSFDFNTLKFTEIDTYNKKIKLTDDIKKQMNDSNSRIKYVLGFNHYGQSKTKYHNESDVLLHFHNWLSNYENPVLCIQNASFDMKFLNVRSEIKFNQEVFDTKMMIQLFYIPVLQKLAETDNKYKEMIIKIGTSDRDNGLTSSSMSKIGPSLGLDMSNYHDAIADCLITTKMTEKILDFLNQNKGLDISYYQNIRIKSK